MLTSGDPGGVVERVAEEVRRTDREADCRGPRSPGSAAARPSPAARRADGDPPLRGTVPDRGRSCSSAEGVERGQEGGEEGDPEDHGKEHPVLAVRGPAEEGGEDFVLAPEAGQRRDPRQGGRIRRGMCQCVIGRRLAAR